MDLLFLCRRIAAFLMENQTDNLARGIPLERDLGLHSAQEEIILLFGEHLDPGLAGSLRYDMVAVQRDRKDDVFRERETAGVFGQ